MQQKLYQAKKRWSCLKVFIFIESFQHLQYIRYFSFIIYIFSKYLFFFLLIKLFIVQLSVCVFKGGRVLLVVERWLASIFLVLVALKSHFFYQFDFFEFLFLRIYLFCAKELTHNRSYAFFLVISISFHNFNVVCINSWVINKVMWFKKLVLNPFIYGFVGFS